MATQYEQYTDENGILHITTMATALLGEKEERIKAQLELGYKRRDACKNAAVWWEQFCRWMERGGEAHHLARSNCPPDIHWEPYYSFAKRVVAAEKIGQALPRTPKSGLKPNMINEFQQTQVLNAMHRGRSFATAARWAGIQPSTLTSILRFGGYPHLFGRKHPPHPDDICEPYISFVEKVQRAQDAYFTGRFDQDGSTDAASTKEP